MERLGGLSRPWGWCLAAVALGGALVATNPDEQDFQEFAGEQLVRLLDEELCDQGGLPMVARLLIQNCSELVQGQERQLLVLVQEQLLAEQWRHRNQQQL